MINVFISIIFIYFFIALGYLAKRFFKDDMDAKTLTLFSVYFLQPFVVIWGFGTAKLSSEHFNVSFVYLIIILLLFLPTITLSKFIFNAPKERAIFNIAGFVGNTGNIGIPLGIALFGEGSIIYTTLVNLANVFIVYILGVYIYSRGSFSIKDSLLNIVKIPMIPASVFAIAINILDVNLNEQIQEFFKMGAYAGIVLQLFLLGTFLYGIKINELSKKLLYFVLSQKFIFVPFFGAILLSLSTLSPLAQGVLFMELSVPLAVANINLASLYDCKPKDVSTLILLSTLLFLPLLFVINYIINMLYL